ncbi:MAG: biosynthetic peptidoglycan transglycosylase [Acidimicrobiales bacterium]
MPTKLGASVVAVEDEHFYSNPVVDTFDGAARAAFASLHTSGDPGGSTVAQQLAKELYGKGNGFGASVEEIGMGLKLSFAFSKVQILVMYLNVVYFGNGYWGDVAAAHGYFGKTPDHLDWAQAAMLAGLPQDPSAYDPDTHFALAKQRQREVLHQLVVNGYLTKVQADAAYRESLSLRRG